MIKPGLAISLFLSVSLFSCDDNKSNSGTVVTTTDSSVSDPKSDTSKKDPKGSGSTLHGITVSQYKITRVDLAAQFSSDKKLIIIKTNFSDLSVPTTLKAMLYPAKNHKDHGQGATALSGVSPQGTTSIETTNMTIGNNYIKLKDVLKKKDGSNRNFTYLLLKPNTIQVPGHLVYQLTAVTVSKEGALVDEEELGYTNPSPPAPPLES